MSLTATVTSATPADGSFSAAGAAAWDAGMSGGITGFGTGVETALQVNVGSAGAVVVNGGALGTPSSGTLTNATGLPVGGIDATGTPGGTTFLRGDGAWAVPSGSGGITWVTKTTNYNAAAGDYILCDTSGGALTITLPGSPSANNAITIKSGYSAASNAVTVARNGNEIMNLTEDMTINTPNLEITLVYNATTGWTL